jgi:outer membrane receptor protein involved in Fe transport
VSGNYVGTKLTVSGSAGYRKNGGEYTEERDRTRLNPATGAVTGTTLTETLSNQEGGGFGNARLSADYDVNPRDRFSAEASLFSFGLKPDGRTNFTSRNAAGAIERANRREFENEFSNENKSLRGSWRRKFSGTEHELVTDFTYNMFDNENDSITREVSLVPVGPDVFERYQTTIANREQRPKVEYARPLGTDQKLRVGYEGQFGDVDYDFRRLRGPTPENLSVDTRFTNRFSYAQDVHAVYGTYERPLTAKLTAQFGLRVEQVEVEIDQITTGVQENDDYLRAYPTLNLGYELNENQRLRAGYSRRVQRPQPFDLNPFPIFIDEQNQRAGNPRLRPEVTDSFEASWQYRKQANFYLATLYYRHATDGITDVIRQLPDGTFLTTRENLAESRRIGLELTANGRLSPKLTYSANINVAQAEIEPSGLFGVTETRSGTIVGGRLSVSWTPTANDFFQLSGFMQGEQLQAQGVREPMGMLNFGYRRKVDERLSLVFSAQNILDTFNEKTRIDTPAFRDRIERRFLAPAAFLGFIYNFGGENQRRRPEPTFEFEQGGGAPPG